MGVNHGSVTYHVHIPLEEKKEIEATPCKSTKNPTWVITNPFQADQSQTHYIIPSLENRHFTGREFTLEDLKQKLFSQPNTEKLALFGLGGNGKTQVALQLAHWVKAHILDCSIFWAPAISLESSEQACSQMFLR